MAKRKGRATGLPSIFLVLFLSACICAPALGNPNRKREYEIKAAFLYNFTKFVAWNDASFPDDRAPFVIAVLGDDPFGDALSALERETAHGRPIVVRRAASLDALGPCHLLFVSSSAESRLAAVLRAAHARNILTVGDMEGFASRGGIIELVLAGDRVGFEINMNSARLAGLAISSKLLALAKIVHRESEK